MNGKKGFQQRHAASLEAQRARRRKIRRCPHEYVVKSEAPGRRGLFCPLCTDFKIERWTL